MRDIKDLCARIEDELSKIADNGLTTGNLEMTYKLIDMYKDIKNTQYWDKKVEYYNTVLDEMRGGYNDDYSERGRKRDSMGRYSSNDGRMMPDYDWGSSYARRGEHYVRGHYSRSDGRDAYDDYMTQKQSYRSGKSEDCKRKMLAALEEHLDELTTEMSDMSKDENAGKNVILSRDTWKNSVICSKWLKHVPQLFEGSVVKCIHKEDL